MTLSLSNQLTYSENLLPELHLSVHGDEDDVGEVGEEVDDDHKQDGQGGACEEGPHQVTVKQIKGEHRTNVKTDHRSITDHRKLKLILVRKATNTQFV